MLADHLRLWTEGGDLVAWTWHDAGEIEWSAWTGQPARDVAVLEGIVETVIAEYADVPVALWSAEDDDPTLGVFAHHGFVPGEQPHLPLQRPCKCVEVEHQ